LPRDAGRSVGYAGGHVLRARRRRARAGAPRPPPRPRARGARRRHGMMLSRKALCAIYAVVGVAAFVGTWGNVLGDVTRSGFVEGTVRFWQDTFVNSSSRFITIDLLFLGLTVIVLMVLEARRLGIPGVWVYVVLGLLVAISLTVPLFMIQRERKLAA